MTGVSQHNAPWWRRVESYGRSIFSKRRGLGLASVALATALVAQGSIVTDASWNDSEWTHGTVGTLDCENPDGQITAQAEGRMLSGSILGTDLDNVAELQGVQVTHDGVDAVGAGGSPVIGVDDAWADPLTVEALNAVSLRLDNFLELPGDTSTGVVGQFAQAQATGEALGSSGAITNSGGIALEAGDAGYPDLATIDLQGLLNSELLGNLELGSVLEPVTNAELTLGAVAGEASFDGCDAIWAAADDVTDEAVAGLSRDYHVSDVELSFESETVGTLVTAVGGRSEGSCGDPGLSVVETLGCTVNGLTGNESVLSELTGEITRLLGNLTDGLGLGGVDLDLAVQVDTSPVQTLLDRELTDDGGVVALNLGDGTVNIDTVALLDAADAIPNSGGLNGLAPNTNPLSEEAVIQELNTRVATLLGDWITDVNAALDGVLDAAIVHLGVDLDLLLAGVELEVNCADDEALVPGCSLGDLLDSSFTAPVDVDVDVLGIDLGLGRIVRNLVNPLVSGLGGLLGTVVENALTEVAELPSKVVDLTNPIISAVTGLYGGLFGGLDPLVSLTFNAQNHPATGLKEPQDWAGLESGRYDVAAVRLGVLDAFDEEAIVLYFGRGSVGPVSLTSG